MDGNTFALEATLPERDVGEAAGDDVRELRGVDGGRFALALTRLCFNSNFALLLVGV